MKKTHHSNSFFLYLTAINFLFQTDSNAAKRMCCLFISPAPLRLFKLTMS